MVVLLLSHKKTPTLEQGQSRSARTASKMHLIRDKVLPKKRLYLLFRTPQKPTILPIMEELKTHNVLLLLLSTFEINITRSSDLVVSC